MSVSFRSVAAALMLAASALAAARSPASLNHTPEVADRPQLEDRFPERRVYFPGGVTAFPDIAFSSGQGFRPLTLDLYVQERRSKALPVILFVHGGGWWSGHSRHAGAFADWPRLLSSVAAHGYVVASVNYRLSAEATFPGAQFDVKSAIAWLRRNADRYSIDTARVGLWGTSAGSQLAALAGTSCEVESLALPVNQDRQNTCVQAVVSWYGVHDFESLVLHAPLAPPVAQYLGCREGCDEQVVRLASPVSHVDSTDPPFLLIHGALDEVVPVAQSTKFHARLQSAGVESRLHVIQDVGHSFIGASHEATRRASLEALNLSIQFFDCALRNGGERGCRRPD